MSTTTPAGPPPNPWGTYQYPYATATDHGFHLTAALERIAAALEVIAANLQKGER